MRLQEFLLSYSLDVTIRTYTILQPLNDIDYYNRSLVLFKLIIRLNGKINAI